MPYPQFLFSEEFTHQKLQEIGISDEGKKRTDLQYLNRWKPADFDRLWNSSNCRDRDYELGGGQIRIGYGDCFSEAFWGRNLKFEDLTVASISVTLNKNE
jgi:hypothetical protein